MLFTQVEFFLFVILTFLFFYIPMWRKKQVAVLIIASIIFYAYNSPYLLIVLLVSATVSAVSSYKVTAVAGLRQARTWAAAGVITNLTILALFKYNRLIFSENIENIDIVREILMLPLPIGLSFYTFHGISLVMDTFRNGNVGGVSMTLGDRNFFSHCRRTLVYLTFFPQLIAGPIVKAHDFFPQIRPKNFLEIDWEGAIRPLIIGYFLKCVVADNLAVQTAWLQAPYYTAMSTYNILFLLFGYSMQIFADFAGYSLIAIGLAKLFGYKLPTNFNFPYVSHSFSEFWTRWHMSLSAWLREYLYIPLGGNRKGRARTYINILIVMGLGGLWHGGTWSYAIWGLWHGLALVIERGLSATWFYRSTSTVVHCLRMAIVFVVVTVGWLLFKFPNLSDLIDLLGALSTNRTMAFSRAAPFLIVLYSLPVVGYHALYLVRNRFPGTAFVVPVRLSHSFEHIAFGGMLAAIILVSGQSNAFIYFQF